jgi:hypothetical protein
MLLTAQPEERQAFSDAQNLEIQVGMLQLTQNNEYSVFSYVLVHVLVISKAPLSKDQRS